jgi:N-acetylglucosaminyl-diphospho-decaprenol L-rhamnosyltransferase
VSEQARVAVGIASWNTRKLLARCLASLEPEHESGRVEVRVVDNASSDGSAEMVAERFPWVELTASTENLGYGSAINRALEGADAEWVVASNADIELEPSSLDELLAAGRRHPGAAALAPRLILPDGTTQQSVHSFPTVPFTALFNSGLAWLVPGLADRLCLAGAWNPERERPVPWAIGAFLMVRRSAWERVGGFDERQWMYAEDLELGWRLDRVGGTVYVPRARIQHRSRASTEQAWGAEIDAKWMASTYAWMQRRRGVARTRAVAAISVAGALVRDLFYAPASRIRPERFARRHSELRRWARLHRVGLSDASEPRAD